MRLRRFKTAVARAGEGAQGQAAVDVVLWRPNRDAAMAKRPTDNPAKDDGVLTSGAQEPAGMAEEVKVGESKVARHRPPAAALRRQKMHRAGLKTKRQKASNGC